MQTAVTVVNLIHDTATEADTPVCHVLPGCSWRQRLSSSGSGPAKDPRRTVQVRIPATLCTAGYLPYAQWAALPAAQKPDHWTLKRGGKLVQGAVRSLTAQQYARLEKTHTCCTISAVSDDREPLLPHWHVEGS
mgnify:CR=1 FL=1